MILQQKFQIAAGFLIKQQVYHTICRATILSSSIFVYFLYCVGLAIDTVLFIEYNGNHMVNILLNTIKKRGG